MTRHDRTDLVAFLADHFEQAIVRDQHLDVRHRLELAIDEMLTILGSSNRQLTAAKLARRQRVIVDELRAARERAVAEPILADVADKYGVTVEDIRGTKRGEFVVLAREEVAWRLAGAGFDWPAVGRAIGKTKMNARRAAERYAVRITTTDEQREAAHGR